MPPPVNIQRRVFGLLSPAAEKDMGVNLVGNLVDIPPECELHQVLRDKGLGPLRHITQYDTFDGFQQMARSQANLVLMPAARYAAEQMNRSLKIPYLYLPVSYRLETIDEQYRQIHQMLLSQRNGDAFDLEIPRMRASQAIEKARSAVGDTPVIVDASATAHPFDLARALMEYGFSVRRIAAQECPACDQDNMRWVMEHHPEVEILQPRHHRVLKKELVLHDSLAVGVDGGYLSQARYVVPLFYDEGMFGYDGVTKLMNMMIEGMEGTADLEHIIEEIGLVV